MLEITNLSAGYDKSLILEKVNLNLQPNEIVSLIGPNGAGKSTILKSIFNQCQIHSGKIIFDEKNITKLPTFELIQEGISYVPQGRQVFPSLTVQENLEMGCFIFDKTYTELELKKIYNDFPILKTKKDEFASNLSGGQQQILAIARALMQRPKLLLLDEPSLGLDPKTMKNIFQTIQNIAKSGIAILMVEQNAKQAVQISDRTYVLEDGKIALEGDKSILKNKKISEIYFGGR